MSIIGFDFGTTNSVMSTVLEGKCSSILDEGLPHPSVVLYRGGVAIAGRKAKEELANSVSGVSGNIVKSPKTMLGKSSVTVDGHTYSPQAVVSDVVAHVMAHAALQNPLVSFNRAVVTIPVDMNGERRRELRVACSMAGMSVYQFVHEPLAALYGHIRNMPDSIREFARLNRQLVLVFDWGGGTLDLTLCRISDGMLVQIKNLGSSDVGGDIIDDMLVREIERKVLAARGIQHEVGHQVGALARLRSAAEKAKIQLSSKDIEQIFVPNYFLQNAGDVDLDYTLSRVELGEIIKEKVNQGIVCIDAILRDARVEASGIAMCLATGGMINTPMIQIRLREMFGAARVEISTCGNTIISQGAAWIAYDRARLVISKNIEILIARFSYFPVILAGALMPRENEIQKPPKPLTLYCSDPTDGVAKFILKSPIRTGRSVQTSDERDILGTLSVPVDSNQRPLIERLLLDVSIDENLILLVKVTSTISGGVDSLEIHSLEFGLQVGPKKNEENNNNLDEEERKNFQRNKTGCIQLRSNVAKSDTDLSVIPGEILYKFNPMYFNRAMQNPPVDQEHENGMYQPCIVCKRIYCNCADTRKLASISPSTKAIRCPPKRPRIGGAGA